ncbi:N-acetylmuramoyl-L-alanine amidase [Escherichia coli]|nr:N-acetylmuramoyl-L-alanine amidase [Escherichia coli]
MMNNWKGIVGLNFDKDGFDNYCHSLHWTQWRPSFIVLHNTANPTLAQRSEGFTHTHIENLEDYYKNTMHWSAGPHLFIDDKQIWVFCPLTLSGVHSPSYNKLAIGIKMLGDYNQDDFHSGRGLLVQQNTVAAIATLSAVLGIDPHTMKLHKEDPETTHKDCPGGKVIKDQVISAVIALMQQRHQGDHLRP